MDGETIICSIEVAHSAHRYLAQRVRRDEVGKIVCIEKCIVLGDSSQVTDPSDWCLPKASHVRVDL